MDSIENLIYGLLHNNHKDVVGTDEVGDYLVDTCYTADAGYETAIKKWGGEWIIVRRYASREEAKEYHRDWVEFCKAAPASVYSVQADKRVEF